MHLKTFSAPSMSDALKLVKDHFGDDAIIVSSQKGDGGIGVRVTAATDPDEVAPFLDQDTDNPQNNDINDILVNTLARHGTPSIITEQLLGICSKLKLDDIDTALASSFDHLFNFKKLPNFNEKEIIMLVGLPGAGKTVTTAKLATKAIMSGKNINVISTDQVRAGGVQQLEAFTKILEIDLLSASDGSSLKEAVAAGDPKCQTIIDCAGGNPFKKADYNRQLDLINSINAKVIMLLADGTDPLEAADLAKAYSELGAEGLIVTRIDVARRHGSLLSAALNGNLDIYGIGVGPSVTDGLQQLNPVSLARLLLNSSNII